MIPVFTQLMQIIRHDKLAIAGSFLVVKYQSSSKHLEGGLGFAAPLEKSEVPPLFSRKSLFC